MQEILNRPLCGKPLGRIAGPAQAEQRVESIKENGLVYVAS
jgi:hypothetical protein